ERQLHRHVGQRPLFQPRRSDIVRRLRRNQIAHPVQGRQMWIFCGNVCGGHAWIAPVVGEVTNRKSEVGGQTSWYHSPKRWKRKSVTTQVKRRRKLTPPAISASRVWPVSRTRVSQPL